jgi:hypothetical protein
MVITNIHEAKTNVKIADDFEVLPADILSAFTGEDK